MYVPQKEKPLGPAALKANLEFYLNEHKKFLDQANVSMNKAKECMDQLVAHSKTVD